MVAHFTVEETKEKQALNTPGGNELLKRLGGPAGLPFIAFLDAGGALIVNSMEPARDGKKAANIGHPAAPHEIDWFLEMLSKAAPRMTAAERAAIEKPLREQKK